MLAKRKNAVRKREEVARCDRGVDGSGFNDRVTCGAGSSG
jgi:hypothetical protein